MLRKSSASNAWAAIFKNADIFWSSLKVQNWENFNILSYLKFFSFFIINGSCEVGHTC